MLADRPVLNWHSGRLKARGFLLGPVDLLVDVTTNEYRSFCPQALISACPTVFKLIPACFNPFSKMLIAALRSRSNTAPQQQIWVLVDSDFLTILPQAEQSWEVYWGATAITVLPYIFPKYCNPKSKLIPPCITNWFGKLVVLNHILHLKVFVGHKIARFYRAGRRLNGEVFALPADIKVFSS